MCAILIEDISHGYDIFGLHHVSIGCHTRAYPPWLARSFRVCRFAQTVPIERMSLVIIFSFYFFMFLLDTIRGHTP